MLKKVYKIFKRIIYAAFILYGYNLIAEPLKVIIPINVINIGIISIFGLPALFSLIAIKLFIFK